MTYATATVIRKIIDKYSINDTDSVELCDYISDLEIENCSLLSQSGMSHDVSGAIYQDTSANTNTLKVRVDIDIKYDLDEKNVFSFDASSKHLNETFIARTLLKFETQLRKITNA